MDSTKADLTPTGNPPRDPGKPLSLLYPIAFFGGVLLLCAFVLHGTRILAPFQHHAAEVEESAERHP